MVKSIFGANFRRRNFTIIDANDDLVKELARMLEALTYAEVIRWSLKSYEIMLEDQLSGLKWIIGKVGEDAYLVNEKSLKEGVSTGISCKRANINIDPKTQDRLDRIRELTSIDSDSHNIVRALQYHWLILSEIESGAKLVVSNGQAKILLHPIAFGTATPVKKILA